MQLNWHWFASYTKLPVYPLAEFIIWLSQTIELKNYFDITVPDSGVVGGSLHLYNNGHQLTARRHRMILIWLLVPGRSLGILVSIRYISSCRIYSRHHDNFLWMTHVSGINQSDWGADATEGIIEIFIEIWNIMQPDWNLLQ